jgi:PfaD family protein
VKWLSSPAFQEKLERCLGDVAEPLWVLDRGGTPDVISGDSYPDPRILGSGRVSAFVPACRLDQLGDPAFCAAHGTRFAFMAGAMANGIGSVEVVEAMGGGGMLGIFGAAGLSIPAIERAIARLKRGRDDAIPYGFNLIHSPQDPAHEAATVSLYLQRGIGLVEASAFFDVTLPLVRYRVSGLHLDHQGNVIAPNRIIAKVSRVEVASKFLAPPPERFLLELTRLGELTPEQAAWAAKVPMAGDLTAEADSGGHTDNQPAIVLLPTMLALRNRLQTEYGYAEPLRVGAAGGISTPWSAAAALAMGASYLVTGSVNQACVEAGTSDQARQMLAQARQADIAMAPAADMFEMGVKVQVLKRGTMFAMRAAKLYELYRTHGGLEQLPDAERGTLEKTLFRAPLEEIWEQTRGYFAHRDPRQIERAEQDPKHKMALVFRWYLGNSSNWANTGAPDRVVDYQIWCGPAMAAFNDWVRGSFLETPVNRRVVTVALNILYGAAVLARARISALQGVGLGPGMPRLVALERGDIEKRSQTSYHSGPYADG